MSIVRNFNLYLNAGNWSAPFINANQYDQGEQWVFTLYKEDGTKYLPSTGAIVGIKADNRGIINTGTVDANGRVVINETQQMTAAAGIAIFELLIDGETHGTANFLVNVEQRPGDNADLSDSDLSLIQQAVDSAAVIVEVIGDGDPSEVIGEHVDAWLDAHPEATTTVEDGAITAPKINQSLWDKLLVSEEASGNPASFDDGADDVPVSSLKVALEPIQLGSGDPSPSNVRPIIASNEKNVVNADGMVNDNFVKSGNDYIFTQNGNGASARSTGYAPFSAVINEPYTFSFIIDNTGGMTNTFAVRVDYADETNEVIYSATISSGYKTATFTPTKETTQIWMYSSSSTANVGKSIKISDIQLERGSSASAYQPYQGIMVEKKGKNLLKNNLEDGSTAGVTYTRNADGSVTCVGTAANTSSTRSIGGGAVYLANGEYILTGTATVIKVRVNLIDENGNVLARIPDNGSGVTFTVDDTVHHISVVCYASSLSAVNETIYPMIRQSYITDAEYVPYEVTSYPMSLGREVYGGTVDLATGVLTVDRAVLSYSRDWIVQTDVGRCYVVMNDAKAPVDDNVSMPTLKCSHLQTISAPDVYNGSQGIGISIGKAIQMHIDGLTDVTGTTSADVNNWLSTNGVQIIYELATPQTIQLTPTQVKTLLGYNNISSSGTVDVIYHADTQMYVEKEVNKAKSIIAGIEAEFKATKNYTTGDLLIIGDDLYKCTANIANGGTITVNTNVTKTTVAEQLIALA